MSIHRMSMSVTVSGRDVDATVVYEYQPRECQTHDYPGCHESATICKILFAGADILDQASNLEIARIECQVLERTE